MDPKALSNIDPKLRETYERVMGTATPSSSPVAPPSAPTQADAPVTQNETAPTSPASMFASSPLPENVPSTNSIEQQTVVTPYNPENASQANAHATNQPLPSPASVAQAAHTQEASPLLRVLYIVGAVLFFIVYTIFWIKIFKLPFLF